MRKLVTNFAAATFAFVIFTSASKPAFAFQIGPFHLGLPLAGYAGASARDVKTEIGSCGSSSAAVDRSVEQIDKSIQVSENQREALDELHQALSQAANDLEAQCSTPLPQSAVGRLDALEARLDATWRGILSIQVALYNFETELSVDQKNRFKTMTFAAQD